MAKSIWQLFSLLSLVTISSQHRNSLRTGEARVDDGNASWETRKCSVPRSALWTTTGSRTCGSEAAKVQS